MTEEEVDGTFPKSLSELRQLTKKLLEDSNDTPAEDLLFNFFRLAKNTIYNQLPHNLYHLFADVLWLDGELDNCSEELCVFSKEKVIKLLECFVKYGNILMNMPIDDEESEDEDDDY